MRVIRPSNSNEVILTWLTAELRSQRFSGDLRKALSSHNSDETLLAQAQIEDEQQNAVRKSVLYKYRDWLDVDFDAYDWDLVELSSDEVANLNYIDYSYWNELSDNTHKVGTAAKNVKNGRVVFDVPNDNFYAVAGDVGNGVKLPPVIVVQDHNGSHDLLEGHVRATGYVLAGVQKLPLIAMRGRLRG